MSLESAKAFIERMKTDEEFAKQVGECKDKEARMTLVREAGFDFTAEEIEEAGSQLSAGDLDGASGGSGGCNEGCGVCNWRDIGTL